MISDQNRIAVIGMACRFPGANNINEYWDNLVNGRDTIKHFSDEELAPVDFDFEALRNNPDYVRARGILSGIDMFDAEFFGMIPSEAAITDPQHRVWLETAWEALENAACDPFTFDGSIGVFAGSYMNTYLLNNILRDKSRLENYIRLRRTESFQILTGNDAAFIPTKTAYKFDLKGPAVNVQTACSTSLVAISQACQSLFSFESDICIAGGIAILVPQESGYLFQEGAIPSPDGKCRPFDAEGKGTVFSNGVGVVVLKRMEDAIRNLDTIYAGIRGWALNNDGSKKVSYMAPSIEGQAEVITMAQSFSGVRPEEIGYIEAHGTATQLGDPIELSALNKVFVAGTDKKQFCGIGSVKSNIGHTDAAAGVASFIKATLSVFNKEIPPTLNFTKPNPHFNFKDSPFYVQDKLIKWERKEPLIIGVSSFGIGGTNAHVILEEPPITFKAASEINQWPDILPISAKCIEALSSREKNLLDHLYKNNNLQLKDIAYTLQKGRHHMTYRTFAVTEDIGELRRADFVPPLKADEHLSGIAFMFSGQGAQYTGMGEELYRKNSKFRQILDECFEIVRSETGNDLKEILYKDPGSQEYENRLASTEVTQPALFIIEYALAKIYMDLGIIPGFLIGHSIGEYSAACVSGVFDLPTALRIVIKRGMLMQRMPSGKMMAVRCGRERLEFIKGNEFEIAADNADNQCTISYRSENGEKIRALLDHNGLKYMPLNTSHAFHSSVFDPILAEFSNYVDQFDLKAPRIPVISCLSGEFLTPDQAISGSYWAKQLRNTVRFRQGISTITSSEKVIFLELGPETHLAGLVKQNSLIVNKDTVLYSLGKRDGISEQHKIISSLGAIWANGLGIDFDTLHAGRSSGKIPLPSYPFQRKRYWIDQPQFEQHGNNISVKETKAPELFGKEKVTLIALKELLCQTSGYSPENITENASFEKMGLDSLFLTQYAQNIYRKFGIKVEFRQLVSEYSTLTDLAHMIDGKKLLLNKDNRFKSRTSQHLNNLIKFQPEGTKDPLIIIHGQNADSFIPEYLGKDHPYYGYLHPGSDGEAISFTSISEMAGAYLDQLFRHKQNGPYYLGGFSFGGVLAFEMAKQLEEMGQQVPFVLLFDTYARKEPFKWHNSLYRIIRNNIAGPLVRSILRLIKLGICESCIMLQKPTPLALRNFYIIEKYFTLAGTFKPKRIKGKLILFRAIENKSSLEFMGWKKYADDLKVIPLNADHVTLLKKEESIRTIQAEIKKLLDSENNDPKNDQKKYQIKIEQHV